MAGNSLKILLIEDNLAEARLLQEFVNQAKSKLFTVVHVKRLAEALEKINQEIYDVILLDLTLPDSQGLGSLPPLIKLNPNIPIDEASFIGKADSGKLQSKLILVDLEEFCRELIDEVQLSIKEKLINLVFFTKGELREGLWDESLLRHILGNLLNNAIKYSPSESTVIFELTGLNKSVIFRIQDQGIGIPKEDQEQLFKPFYRASNVGSISGTGLGLAIVKKCIEAHGGQITVDSELGVGTSFTVILPIVRDKI